MRFRVAKFGGSNLKTPDDLMKVAHIIETLCTPDSRLVVVVSALHSVTDRLLDAINGIRTLDIGGFLTELYEMHARFLGRDDDELHALVFSLQETLQAVKLLGKTPDFARDAVVSHGERCSALLLSKVLNELPCAREVPFVLRWPERFIFTDGRFGNGTVILEKTRDAVLQEINSWEAANSVVPGFYGVSNSGDVVTLGRGGSDYTATALGYCLDAEFVVLFKDVHGFMTGDPRMTTSPRTVSALSYDEADELSYFGAKVLQNNAVEPLRLKSLPLYICNVENGFSESSCTKVVGEKFRTQSCIKSISSSRDIAVVQFKGRNLGRVPGVLGEISSAVAKRGINIKFVITSQTSICLVISKDDLEVTAGVAESLRLPEVEEIVFKTDKALVAVVGEGLLDSHGIASRIFKAVASGGVNVEMISAGASDVALYFIVQASDEQTAVRLVHDEFFNSGTDHGR